MVGYTNFGWTRKGNSVAFSDYYAIYILNCDTGKLKLITGNWQTDYKEYQKGGGYPKWCHSFVCLNNDTELHFTYYPDIINNPEGSLFYRIRFM